METLESRIAEWRAYVAKAPAVDGRDLDELEAHLRDQIAELDAAGLSEAEAFLVAVGRMGDVDSLSREFAREHSGRLWKQLVLTDADETGGGARDWLEPLLLAAGAGLAMLVALLAAGHPYGTADWMGRNVSLLVLPFLWAYLARRRGLSARAWALGAIPFGLGGLLVNLYPFAEGSGTQLLAAAHLPVLLWFSLAFPYMGATLASRERLMDFVRFTGEWLIYYTLIALGGGVLSGLTAAILFPIEPSYSERVMEWALPVGAAGATVVAAWLVESKQHVVENMAPVLTMVFTPLFAVMLTGVVVVYVLSGMAGEFDRELLAIFDALMVVVLGLVVYAMSARDPSRPPGLMDRVQLLAVVSALALDVMILAAMVLRIGELGFTPNRVAALGLNLLLLVNLAWTAWLSARFLRGRVAFHALERWQTSYAPVFAVWAAAVVSILPPLFGFR